MLNVALLPILPGETHSAADDTSRFPALRVHAISLIPQSMMRDWPHPPTI
jgi:hypothetical protein